MDWVVVLGGNRLNGGFYDMARAWDCKLAVVDWNESVFFPHDKHIRIDIKEVSAVLHAVAQLPGRIVLACTSADIAVETASQINATVGLLRPTQRSVELASNKVEQNRIWRNAGLTDKQFASCRTAMELGGFARHLKRKLIVKPVDAASSRGITVIDRDEIDAADWQAVFARAAERSILGAVIAEEFTEGIEFTVEMLGDSQGSVDVWGVSKKYHTNHTNKNRVAVKLHYNPNDVSRDRQERIAGFGADCFKALNLSSCFGHFECIETTEGNLFPIEIGARSSGYIGTHLVSLLSGEVGAYFAALRQVLSGEAGSNGLRMSHLSAMYFFYDPPPGRWMSNVMNLMTFLPEGLQSVASDRSRLCVGTNFGLIDSDSERYGHEILVGRSSELTAEVVKRAEAALYTAAVEVIHRDIKSGHAPASNIP